MIDNTKPPRVKRRDFTSEYIDTRPHQTTEPKETFEDKKLSRSSPKNKLKSHKTLAVALIVIMGLAVVGFLALRPKPAPAIFPAQVANTVSYPLYYAADKIDGYAYQAGSASNRAGIIFYTLQNRKKNIIVSQQNAPTTPVNLKSLPKYTNLNIPIGQAVIGTGLGNPSIVIITPKTLIQITSKNGVTKDEITHLAQNLSLLNQQPAY